MNSLIVNGAQFCQDSDDDRIMSSADENSLNASEHFYEEGQEMQMDEDSDSDDSWGSMDPMDVLNVARVHTNKIIRMLETMDLEGHGIGVMKHVDEAKILLDSAESTFREMEKEIKERKIEQRKQTNITAWFKK